ncbi:MAG TPA: glycogen synthase [Candidatus Polarisedimenticolaceae bacterium]|nr:glycogen synthase [Candidatus Polarisedimenticolaceae bacterium]
MPSPRKILLLSAEVAPFAKTGGLADVAGALPKALAAHGHDVRVVMPAYASIKGELSALPGALAVPTGAGPLPAGAFVTELPGSRVPVYLIAERNLFDRPQIYGYDDDPYRFAFFSKAALALCEAIGWKPDLVHAHDWHAAPAITWLATAGAHDGAWAETPTAFTIHNLAHQGRSARTVMGYLGAAAPTLLEEGPLEVNFMARGIYHATMVNTVSPTYAREIVTAAGGSGLDRLLAHRRRDLRGILNGIDDAVWDPATDAHLAAPFGADRIEARGATKRALQEKLGLAVDEKIPLVGMVTRLDAQKGLEITGHVLHLLMSGAAGDVQCVVLGTGAAPYEDMLRHLASYHRGKMRAVLAFASDVASMIYGGSDLFLMPSLFEPCGLSQLIAMRYGSVPVVRATGGLADTVREGETGFTFVPFAAPAFWTAIQRALFVLKTDRARWRRIQENGMRADHGWGSAAREYERLYDDAVSRAARVP